jgi:hypothetical protein
VQEVAAIEKEFIRSVRSAILVMNKDLIFATLRK